jgi:hypothetical protein
MMLLLARYLARIVCRSDELRNGFRRKEAAGGRRRGRRVKREKKKLFLPSLSIAFILVGGEGAMFPWMENSLQGKEKKKATFSSERKLFPNESFFLLARSLFKSLRDETLSFREQRHLNVETIAL